MLDKIKKFSTEFAPKGVHRDSVSDMKKNIFKDAYHKMMMNPMSLKGIRRVAQMK
jgi:hemolysin-activating ACP:hemolysin acyltransferase